MSLLEIFFRGLIFVMLLMLTSLVVFFFQPALPIWLHGVYKAFMMIGLWVSAFYLHQMREFVINDSMKKDKKNVG